MSQEDLYKSNDNDQERNFLIRDYPEWGIKVREVKIVLIPEKQRELGITSYIRKEIIDCPDELRPLAVLAAREAAYDLSRTKEERDQTFKSYVKIRERLGEIFYELSNGAYPSIRTWTHSLNADRPDLKEDSSSRFKEEGLFFQPIVPKEHYSNLFDMRGMLQGESDFFRKSEEGLEKIKNTEIPQLTEDSLFVFDMSVMPGYEDVWDSGKSGIVFSFGSKNLAFRDYIISLSKNPEVLEMLRLDGWDIKDYDFESFNAEIVVNKFKKISDRCGFPKSFWDSLKGEDMNYPNIDEIPIPEWVGDHLYEYAWIKRIVTQDSWTDEQKAEAKRINWENDKKNSATTRSLALLKEFVFGNSVFVYGHPHIPIIQHPAITSLRWCHADAGLIATDRSFNVLLFEKNV